MMNKLVEDGKELVIVSSTHLECTTSGHNKFWHAWLLRNNQPLRDGTWKAFPYVVKLHYGAIGTKGATLLKGFDYEYDAGRYIEGREKDKRTKGYVAIGAEQAMANIKKPKLVSFESKWDLV